MKEEQEQDYKDVEARAAIARAEKSVILTIATAFTSLMYDIIPIKRKSHKRSHGPSFFLSCYPRLRTFKGRYKFDNHSTLNVGTIHKYRICTLTIHTIKL